ncbi:MAG: AI-2E family transporter [Gammaproteobacteria bacterium]
MLDTSTAAQAQRERQVIKRLLSVIAVVVVAGALKITTTVTMPLVFALFLIAVFWPLQLRLERHMARGLAMLITFVAFLAVIALFVASFWWSGELLAASAPEYRQEFQRLYEALRLLIEPIIGAGGDAVSSGPRVSAFAPNVVLAVSEWFFSFSGALVLIIAFFVLGLLEVHDFRDKLRHRLSVDEGERWFESFKRVVTDFQIYIVVRTVIGLITGVLIWLLCLAVGLDFAFIWGFINFLLSYIPTVGAIIGVVPVSAFALLEFGIGINALLVLVGASGIQIVMGIYIDPLLQGRQLSLSPLVVLFSVTFWGWLWGVPGAFIAIPITITLVIACDQYERTRWIAVLLADYRDKTAEADKSPGDGSHDTY